MTRSEKALKFYAEGFNCAQSVIASFADILQVDEQTAIRIASGFGGGMGRMQDTCGAITGAFMVIGYLRGKHKDGDNESAENTNQLIQEFSKKFSEKHGSIKCKSLINYDLNSVQGLQAAKDADVFNKKCAFFVKTAVEMLEEILT